MQLKPVFMVLALLAAILFATVSAGNNNWSKEALADEIVGGLPDAPAYGRQFSGYITVQDHTHLFYYFSMVPDAAKAVDAPVVFWTSGGPGCSGLIGAFTEMGAYQPVPDGKGGVKLALRAETPNEQVNMLYIEQPDVGFTYIDDGFAPSEWFDADVAERNAEFIFKWFTRFQNLKGNKFAIWSESYGGHYIPTLERSLIKHNAIEELNFSHALVGNPLIYLPWRDFGQYWMYITRNLIPWYGIGDQYQQYCMPDPTVQPNPPADRPSICSDLEEKMDALVSLVDPYAMSFPICVDSSGKLRSSSPYQDNFESIINSVHDSQRTRGGLSSAEREAANRLWANNDKYFPANYQECEEDHATDYLNRKDVQQAFHATLKRSAWGMCNSVNWSQHDFVESTLPIWRDNYVNSKGRVKQLIYSGTDDTMCSTFEAQTGLAGSKQFKVVGADWQPVSPAGQLVGYKTQYGNADLASTDTSLTFITVHGAGHMAPSTRPTFTKYIVEAFLNDQL